MERKRPDTTVVGLRGPEARNAHINNLVEKLVESSFPADEAEKRPRSEQNKHLRRLKALQEALASEVRQKK